MKPFRDSHRRGPVKSRETRQIFFVLFEVFMSFVSRMHIAGMIKQISLILERKVRSVVSTLLRNTLLRNPVVAINGVKYYLSDMRLESLFILSPEYEKYVWERFQPTIGEVFIDVGAHVGKYTLQVARIVGDEGLVIALEPHPGNYRALLTGIQLNGFRNIVTFKVAAWNRNCKLRLFIHEAAVYHSAKTDAGLGYVEVEARTIDEVIADLSVKQVDWIKIDAEDAEMEVLQGLKKTLAKYAPRLILEVQWKNLKDVLNLMESCYYVVKPIAGEQNPKDKFGYFYCEPLSLGECLT